MPHYIAFLRGINLGNRRLKMDQLRGLFEALKFRNVATFIASGNVIFESAARDASKLELQIERHLERSLGYPVDTFIRTRAEVARIAAFRPFPEKDLANPAHTLLGILFKTPLDPALARQVMAIRTDVDAFRFENRELYWLCRIRMSESKVWTLPEMRALKLPTSSMRNLTTLRLLAERFPPPAR